MLKPHWCIIQARQPDYRLFKFDVLMANPPFAGDIKQSDMLSPYDLAHKKDHKLESAVGRDLLFIERNLDFLKPGGRMAVVLPQGRFNNLSDQRVREFIMERCRVLAVVGLHPNTFKPHTGIKTSVLFVQKWNDNPATGPLCPKVQDYNIFFATQQVESVNNSGEKVYVRRSDGSLMRDTHRHFIVAHDLYNHDGLTKDGIAEAFQEFAKGEQLSFFSPSSFDSDRLSGLLKGLEASILPVSEVRHENPKIRFDNGYFAKRAVAAECLVEALPNYRFGEITSVFRKGIFDIKADTYVEPDEGVPFVRIGDLRSGLIRKGSTAWIDQNAHRMEAKTALKFGDLVLSKTAYPAASMVNLQECNVSQDTIAVRLNALGRKHFKPGFIAAFLNAPQGSALMARRFQGNVQQHLSLEDGKALRIPLLTPALQSRVHEMVLSADLKENEVVMKQDAAEAALLAALGLADWRPPEPLNYTARASDTFDAGRLDARFFGPRIQALLDILGRDARTISDVASPRRQKFRPEDCTTFSYVEISDIDGTGATGSTPLACTDAPSRATWYVEPDDIISSCVRPIRRLSAQIAPEQGGFVCSSGFVVIRPDTLAPELLLTYLRLPVICELLDIYASASMYPAVTDAHIFGLSIPEIDAAVESRVVGNVRKARVAKAQASWLLDAATRAVEIAINDGGAAAMAFLAKAERAI